jgi:hypothetical protein
MKLVSPKRLITLSAITAILLNPTVASAAGSPSIVTMPGFSITGTAVTYTPSVWSSGTPRDYLVACSSPRAEINPDEPEANVTATCRPLYQNPIGDPTNPDLTIATDLSTALVPEPGTSNRRLYLPSRDGQYLAALSLNSGRGVSTATTGYTSEDSPVTSEVQTFPSPKIPTINQMSSGSLLVTPGTNAVLTGSRLNCTTYVKVNNVSTTFTYSNLSDGSGQLSIAMPSSLRAGKHALTMDSCGGEVTYLNVLTVAKAPVELRLDLANASDRTLGLIELRAFMREHRADYNTVTCTADSANRSQQKIASQVVARYCHEAFSRLAMPMNRTTSVKSDYQGRSLILTVSLSNR